MVAKNFVPQTGQVRASCWTDPAEGRNGTATSEAVQVCLMPVQYDQYPKDRETDRFADQTHSGRDPLKDLSAKHPVGRSDFRL